MSSELATTDKQSVQLDIGTKGYQLTTLDEAWRFAEFVLRSGLAPDSFNTKDKIIIAVQLGHEVGLSPMQALSTIAVVKGKPSFWGQALPALAHRSGVLAPDGIQEWFERDGKRLTAKEEAGTISDDWVAVCKTIRKDQTEGVTRRFSVEDAKRAKLWGASDKPTWRDYPKDMLMYKARARSFKANLADVLMGLEVVEDIQDIEPRTVTVSEPPAPSPDPLADKIFDGPPNETDPTPVVEATVETPKPEPDDLIKDIESAIKSCSKLGAWQKTIAKECVGENWRDMDADELKNGLLVVNELSSLMETQGKPGDENELLALISDAKGILTA